MIGPFFNIIDNCTVVVLQKRIEILVMLPAPTLKQIDERIEKCCHETEKKDTHKKPIHLKDLARVDDQISKPFSGSQKFTDDHAYEAESDVDFHVTDDCRKRKRKYDL